MKPNAPESSPKQAAKPVWNRVAENLFRYEPSGGYYAVIKRGGKLKRKALRTSDRLIAKARLEEFRRQLGAVQPQENSRVGFRQLAEEWLASVKHTMKESSIRRRQDFINGLAPFFEGVAVRNLTPRHCEAWVAKRGYKISAQSFAHELETLRAVFAYAIKLGLALGNPARDIKRKRIVAKRPQVPTREQFRQIVAAIRESDGRPDSQAKAQTGADFVELLAYTGCRLSEAQSLKWSDVDFGRGVFTVTGGEHGTKNHEVRTVPLNDALRQLLTRLREEKPPQPGDFIVTTASPRKCIDTACRKLDLPHITRHALRHFYATTCIESGVDIPTVSRWLGHKDGGALLMKTYSHLHQEHSLSMAKRVNFGTEQPANVVTVRTEASA